MQSHASNGEDCFEFFGWENDNPKFQGQQIEEQKY